MADSDLNVRIKAHDQASGVLTTLRGKVAALAGAFLAWRAIKDVTQFVGEAVTAARKETEGLAKLDAALRQVGTSYGAAKNEIEGLVTEQQRWTRYGDDQTRATLQTLLGLTGDYQASLRTVAAAQNLAEGSGRGLGDVTLALGRALAGQDGMLARINPRLLEGADALSKTATASERAAFWTGRIAVIYGDAARNIDPMTLSLARLSNGWGDVKEALGSAVITAEGTNGALEMLAGLIDRLAVAVAENQKAIRMWVAGGLKLALGALGMLVEAVGMLSNALQRLKQGLVENSGFWNDWGAFIGITAAKVTGDAAKQNEILTAWRKKDRELAGEWFDLEKVRADRDRLVGDLSRLLGETMGEAGKVGAKNLMAGIASSITLPETVIAAKRPKLSVPKPFVPVESERSFEAVFGAQMEAATRRAESVRDAVDEIRSSVMDLLPLVGTAGLRTELSALAENADQLRDAWADPETPARLEAIRDKISGISIETGKAVEQTWELDAASRTVQDVVVSLAQSFGTLFGALITGSENAARAFAAAMLGAIGQIAVALGTLLIGKAFETYPFVNVGLMAIGAGLIAFGTSLGAIASALGAKASQGMGAGGYVGAAPSLNAANAESRQSRAGQTVIVNINTGQSLDTKDSISRAVGEALVYGRRRGIMPAGAY